MFDGTSEDRNECNMIIKPLRIPRLVVPGEFNFTPIRGQMKKLLNKATNDIVIDNSERITVLITKFVQMMQKKKDQIHIARLETLKTLIANDNNVLIVIWINTNNKLVTWWSGNEITKINSTVRYDDLNTEFDDGRAHQLNADIINNISRHNIVINSVVTTKGLYDEYLLSSAMLKIMI